MKNMSVDLNDYQTIVYQVLNPQKASSPEVKLIQKYTPVKPPNHDQIIIILLVVCLICLVLLVIALSVIIIVYAVKQENVPDWFANGSNITFQISAVIIPLIVAVLIVVIILMSRNQSKKQKNLIVGLAIANTVLSGIVLCASLAISVVLVLNLASFINLTPLVSSLIMLPCSFATIIIPLVRKTKVDEVEEGETKVEDEGK